MMLKNVVLVFAVVVVGCVAESDDVDAIVEIVGNLERAGYPAGEIDVDDAGRVIVGGDAVVVDLICVDGTAYTGTLSMALDTAIGRYNALDLQFRFERTNSADAPGCDATITMRTKGWAGGMSGRRLAALY